MSYAFHPLNLQTEFERMFTLEDALRSLEGRKEFAVRRYDGLVCINYLVQLTDSFEGIRGNFRGITFDERTGQVVSLPLHKFFNVGQTLETSWDNVRHLGGTVYEKLDGSMIHFFEHGGDLRAATRMSSESWQAKSALALARKNVKLWDTIVGEVRAGYTPIFEYVAPQNQIVVEYPQSRLVYLCSRNRTTGCYSRSLDFEDRARQYEFHFSAVHDFLDGQEFEGYVCVLENGLWVKVKCGWYMERHRAVDALMRPAYRLYEVALTGIMDDLIALAPDRYKDRLRTIHDTVQLDYLEKRRQIEELHAGVRRLVDLGNQSPGVEDKDDKALRKAYACYCQEHHPEDMSLLMTVFCGKDPEEGIKKRLLEGYKVQHPNRLFADLEEDA